MGPTSLRNKSSSEGQELCYLHPHPRPPFKGRAYSALAWREREGHGGLGMGHRCHVKPTVLL